MTYSRDPRNYPFAVYGELQFQLARSPRRIQVRQDVGFSQHDRLSGKPLLQKVGDALETIDLEFQFHHQFCVPQDEFAKLRGYAEAKNPAALTIGDRYQGYFVIANWTYDLLVSDSVGTPLAIAVALSLTEWIGQVGAETPPSRFFAKRIRKNRTS